MSPPPSSSYNQGQLHFGNAGSPSSMHSSSRVQVMPPPAFDHQPLVQEGTAYSATQPAMNLKRKRRGFELTVETTADVVSKGMISMADAYLYFQTFFQGCVSDMMHIKTYF